MPPGCQRPIFCLCAITPHPPHVSSAESSHLHLYCLAPPGFCPPCSSAWHTSLPFHTLTPPKPRRGRDGSPIQQSVEELDFMALIKGSAKCFVQILFKSHNNSVASITSPILPRSKLSLKTFSYLAKAACMMGMQ